VYDNPVSFLFPKVLEHHQLHGAPVLGRQTISDHAVLVAAVGTEVLPTFDAGRNDVLLQELLEHSRAVLARELPTIRPGSLLATNLFHAEQARHHEENGHGEQAEQESHVGPGGHLVL